MTSPRISTLAEYNVQRQKHWDKIARTYPAKSFFSREYHHRLGELYRHFVSPGLAVLEIGCGCGDFLASVAPALGVGVDFSVEMLHWREKTTQH